MRPCFALSLIAILVASPTFYLSAFAAEQNEPNTTPKQTVETQTVNEDEQNKDKFKLNADERKTLDRTTLSFRANELEDMYAQAALMNAATFDRGYMIDTPLQLREVFDFNHPYLNVLVSELTESDRDAILESIRTEKSKHYRYKSIMQTAMKFSTNAALYKRTQDFHARLLGEYYFSMSQIFPFHALTLEEGKIRPPRIEEIGFTRTLEDKRTRRERKSHFRISRQAEVINEPQTFMDFFTPLMTEKPTSPNVYMLPINEEELQYWRKGVLHGWVEGNRLGNEIIRNCIRNAVAEFNGQLRFHHLARANIVSRPTSKNTVIGTSSNGNMINIGESIFEIIDLPRFNAQEQEWLALPQADDIFDELTKEDVDELSIYLDYVGTPK